MPGKPEGTEAHDGPEDPHGREDPDGLENPHGREDPDGPEDPVAREDQDGLEDPHGRDDPDGPGHPDALGHPDGPEVPGRPGHPDRPERSGRLDYAVVIPTIGRVELAALVASADRDPAPRCIVVADDRRQPSPDLDLPVTRVPLLVVRTGGRGPAAARNAGWRAAAGEWVAFLDDDVLLADDWARQLSRDLIGQPGRVGASQARLHVPLPPGQRPTDEQRRTTGLVGSPWITADMAYRRTALLATDGFDERFPRAFREDSDLAYRAIVAGYSIVWGDRVTTHPLVSRGGWRSSIRAQAGNADSALLRAKYGPRWRSKLETGRGRTPQHAAAVALALLAVSGLLSRRRLVARLGSLGWAALTVEFAARRIVPGPRTPAEIATMLVTSATIPPVAVAHRLLGEFRVRRAGVRPLGHPGAASALSPEP